MGAGRPSQAGGPEPPAAGGGERLVVSPLQQPVDLELAAGSQPVRVLVHTEHQGAHGSVVGLRDLVATFEPARNRLALTLPVDDESLIPIVRRGLHPEYGLVLFYDPVRKLWRGEP